MIGVDKYVQAIKGMNRSGAAMPSDVSEDTSPTGRERAMLKPDSPKNSNGRNPDKEGGTLVIPAKAMVGENMIIDIRSQFREE